MTSASPSRIAAARTWVCLAWNKMVPGSNNQTEPTTPACIGTKQRGSQAGVLQSTPAARTARRPPDRRSSSGSGPRWRARSAPARVPSCPRIWTPRTPWNPGRTNAETGVSRPRRERGARGRGGGEYETRATCHCFAAAGLAGCLSLGPWGRRGSERAEWSRRARTRGRDGPPRRLGRGDGGTSTYRAGICGGTHQTLSICQRDRTLNLRSGPSRATCVRADYSNSLASPTQHIVAVAGRGMSCARLLHSN